MGREPDTRRGDQDTNIGDQDAFMEQVMSWPPCSVSWRGVDRFWFGNRGGRRGFSVSRADG